MHLAYCELDWRSWAERSKELQKNLVNALIEGSKDLGLGELEMQEVPFDLNPEEQTDLSGREGEARRGWRKGIRKNKSTQREPCM